jgi:transposase InsO family protein
LTEQDVYPVPNIDDMLNKLAKAKIFSVGDAWSGFWQIILKKSDRVKTAFRTPWGLFEFVVMPFGLKNATATFQRAMDRMLEGILYFFVMVYVDDLLIYSGCLDDHLEHLQIFFNRLRRANLKLKGRKCKFGIDQVTYLGFTVKDGEIRPNREKVLAIEQFPTPKNPSDIKRFTGMTQFYRRFIKDYAKIAGPLTALTKKDAIWNWNETHDRLLWCLKHALMQEPTLRLPDLKRPFLLYTDASGFALGAILAQKDEKGDEYVVYYASRSLNSAETRYATIEKECLAVAWAVGLFRPYLYGQKFTVITDHKPLVALPQIKDTSERLMKWSLKLAAYDYHIEYRKGNEHGNVDALSRIVLDATQVDHDEPTIEQSTKKPELLRQEVHMVSSVLAKVNLGEEQRSDKSLDWYFKQAQNPNSSYVIHDGLLCKKSTLLMVVAPTNLRKDILHEFHDDKLSGGHLRFQKCLAKIQERFWWPRMRNDLKEWLDRCIECQTRYPNGITSVDTMLNIEIAGPWDTIGMDLVGPITTSNNGNRYILVITDYFTKWAEAFPLAEHSAEAIAKILVEEVMRRYSPPRRIITDRGKEFLSEIMFEVLDLLGIDKLNTTAYHPQTDGLVERFNRTLIGMISMYTSSSQTDWDTYIPYVLFAYNSSKHASTGFSPFFLMFARHPNFTIDTIRPFKNNYLTPDGYAEHVRKSLELAYKRAKEAISRAQQRQKEYYEKHKRTTPVFQEKDQVLYWMQVPPPGLTFKLLHRWYGPYEIVEKKSAVNYLIRDPRNNSSPFVVHVNTLKAFKPPMDGRPNVAISQFYPEEDNEENPVPSFVNDPVPDPVRAMMDIGIGLEKDELPTAPDPPARTQKVVKATAPANQDVVHENQSKIEESAEVVADERKPARSVKNKEDEIRAAMKSRDTHGKKKKPTATVEIDRRKRIAEIRDCQLENPATNTPQRYLVLPEGEDQAIWVDVVQLRTNFQGSDAKTREWHKKHKN